MTKDEYFMQKALDLARKGIGKTSPNPLVGCVIVKQNKIVGKGYHKMAGGPHAEINALEDAREQSKGATLYVNLEPCNHYGRRPPCTEKIIKAGISQVIIGMQDPNPLVSGKGIFRLRQAGIDVKVGVLEKQAKQLNEVFIKYITKNTPFVIAKIAQSIDGKIALSSGKSKWITGRRSREEGHKLRHVCDGIAVGIKTVLADDPRLTCRLKNGKNPIKIVVDSKAKLPLESRLLESGKVILATTENADIHKIESLHKIGVDTIKTSGKNKVNLTELLLKLGKMNITSVLIEGGAKLLTSFLREDLIDKLVVFLSPKIIGGDGINAIDDLGIEQIKDIYSMKITNIQKLEQDIKMELYPRKGEG